MTVKDLKSYQILNEKHVKELNSEGILLEHKKTGARVFLLSNDDENKVFCIGFRTPPSDSTGCAAYHGAQRSVRFGEISGQGSVCRAGEGLLKYLLKRDDLPG